MNRKVNRDNKKYVGESKMGVWMIGTGSISIKPKVDEALIKEYIQF